MSNVVYMECTFDAHVVYMGVYSGVPVIEMLCTSGVYGI